MFFHSFLIASGAFFLPAFAAASPAGNLARGAVAFRQCAACHSLEPGLHLTGPSLAGIFGRKAGTAKGFARYSNALKKSSIVWNGKTLDDFLKNPQGLIPGNLMLSGGDERHDSSEVLMLSLWSGENDTVGMMKMKSAELIPRRSLLAAGVVMIGTAVLNSLSGCGSSGADSHRYKLAPESILPADIRNAPEKVREAYRFALANRETLRYIPCYCGCGAAGHTSNASCYFKDSSTPEKPVFDRMSLNWDICINITRDVMRMMDEGKSLKEMRAYVDQTYSKYGPSTPTPPVP
jgi:cytochrome c2